MESELMNISREYEDEEMSTIGIRGEYVYRMDNNSNEYYMVVIFDSEEAYKRNAASPEQDMRYQKFRNLLVADPEWHDGTIVYARAEEPVR
jgi:hypothetical protein